MFETMTLDSKTLIIKSDNEKDLLEIINFINNKKDKRDSINSFLNFTEKNRIKISDYKFNREDCYGSLK